MKDRYQAEVEMLKKSEQVDDFEIFRLFSEEGKKTSQYITLRARTSGSFLIYLLGHNRINPLKAHYYCKKCGHLEVIDTHLFGMDLPKKACPDCKEEMIGDGYNLAMESVWGIDGKKYIEFDYNISSGFLPFAKRVLQKTYPENQIVSYGIQVSCEHSKKFNPDSMEMKLGGYVVLPQNRTMEDYPELVAYLEDGEPCITGWCSVIDQYNLKKITLYSDSCVEYLMQLQQKSGIYTDEIGTAELRELKYYDLINTKVMDYEEEEIFNGATPQSFYDMVNYSAMPHNSTFAVENACDDWYHETKERILDSPCFQSFPCYTREDFFDYLVECGLEREEAFYFSELIRKGRATRSPEMDKLSIPDELKKVAKMYRYVFPRAHCIEYMLMYARLAYYLKCDSRVYSAVINKKSQL
ncbi:MAG: hypothetical protein ACI39H_00075 [Lachnospiraceae bacterium]